MDHKATPGEVFNIGNDEEISIENLAKLIIRMTGSRSRIVHIPYDKAYEEGFEDMQRRVPDLAKIKKWTGYQPRHQLRQILEKMVEHERGQVEA
jgi:UDP-glucose 4-epimerase